MTARPTGAMPRPDGRSAARRADEAPEPEDASEMELRPAVANFFRDPDHRRDPRPLYDRLLAEAPVFPVNDAFFLVSGYDEILIASKSPYAVTDFAGAGNSYNGLIKNADVVSKMLPMRAGADHARLRRLATAAFSARTVAAVRPGLAATITDLLAPHLAAGHFDVVADLARPLPAAVSCALLGIPAEDRVRVSHWAQQFVAGMSQADDEFDAMREYIEHLCAQRLGNPGEDLISRIVAARAAGVIDADELFAFVLMLFVNGLDTLTAGLTMAIWHVIQQPDWLGRIADDAPLAEAVFDETLRLSGPVRASARVLTADLDLGGHTLAKGTGIGLLYAAANRDPKRFPDPDRLNPFRTERHIALGHGVHHCLGAALSLTVGGTVLGLLARNCRALSTPLTPATAPWQTSLPFAGLDALPVQFEPVTSVRDEAAA
jgi:cytochrome P450